MATTLFTNLTLTSSLKRKLPSEDYIIPNKIYCLEEDSFSSSEEAESIYSVQNRDTASAHDTSDTSEDHEYEVRSLSEVTLSELSSGPENCLVMGNFSSLVDTFGSEIEYVADLSDSSNGSDIMRFSHRPCEKCKGECEEPFTLCVKCFRERRMYLPSRPKGGRRRRKNEKSKRSASDVGPSISQESGSLVGSQGSVEGSIGGSQASEEDLVSQPSQPGSSQSEQPKNICKCCFSSPVDGVFIHKNSVHQIYCYKCSMKQWRLRGRCAFCNQKLCKVAKIFPVE